jgi:hypothetical protein
MTKKWGSRRGGRRAEPGAKSLDFRFLFAIVAVVEETEAAGGSIASLGSPEPLAVTSAARLAPRVEAPGSETLALRLSSRGPFLLEDMMGTCVETPISAMKADAWTAGDRAKELALSTVAGHERGMVDELSDVPRPTLQTVFGQDLGRRIWAQGRHKTAAGIDDAEIIGGMIEYVSRRAGEALRKNGRQARAIGLRLQYADEVATLHRMRLARPTCDSGELLAAGMELLGRAEARGVAVESVDLKVTSVQTELVRERTSGWDYAMRRAAAGMRA